MIDGKIKTFDAAKGYGFIQPADGSRAIFFHSSLMERAGIATLVAGQRLQFDMEHDIRGRRSPCHLHLVCADRSARLTTDVLAAPHLSTATILASRRTAMLSFCRTEGAASQTADGPAGKTSPCLRIVFPSASSFA